MQLILQQIRMESHTEHKTIHLLTNIPNEVLVIHFAADAFLLLILYRMSHHIALFMICHLRFRFHPCPKILAQNIQAKRLSIVNAILPFPAPFDRRVQVVTGKVIV